jgi:Serine carboxypeptidase
VERRFLAQVNANDESESPKFKIQSSPFSGTTSSVPEFVNDTAYERGYVTNQDGVASDMMTFLHKFYENFPEKRKADLFLASESYGGNDTKDVTDMQGNTLHL